MKKHFLFVPTFLLTGLFVKAQDTTAVLSKMQLVPSTGEQNKLAQDLVKNALQSGDGSALFDAFVILGPRLWNRYGQMETMKNIPEGNVDFKVQLFDKDGNREGMGFSKGKLAQSAGDFNKVWQQLSSELKGGTITITGAKDLTNRDRFLYWLLFANKLEEPVFVISANNKRFLFKIGAGTKLFFIEDMSTDQ
jgi:hypothetical protein